MKVKEIQKSSKLLFIFLEAFSDPFVIAVEAASQSSSGTKAKLHKVEAAEEGLLLGKTTEYAASQAHRLTPVPIMRGRSRTIMHRGRLALSWTSTRR
jgi:hypothetical protein